MPPADPLVLPLPVEWDAWSTFQRVAHLPYALFLDSASHDLHLGRYSFITADPIAVEIASGPEQIRATLRRVRQQYEQWHRPHDPSLPPFQGGLAGLWGYGVSRAFERLPTPSWRDVDLPDLVLGWYDWVIAYDHSEGRSLLLSTGLHGKTDRDRPSRARTRADHILTLISAPHPVATPLPTWMERCGEEQFRPDKARPPSYPLRGHPGVWSSFTPDGFRQVIRRGIEYTHAGDCFQVNLAQRLVAEYRDHPLDLYARLRRRNATQFAGYFDLGGRVIASASPERFISCDASGFLETRPIKGTRPRGGAPDDDARLARELRASPKDRAENIMIVDLLRNDLGRVAEYGSVHVENLCALESNAAVHHLVSVVTARLRRGLTPFDVLTATFPGGSVTGAPKVRAMEIIAELEPICRGAYCGSLGYLSLTGAMDTSILIRTFTLARRWAYFPVGGGIVADSDPDQEFDETLHKAQGLLAVLA